MRAIDADALKEQIKKGLGVKSFENLLPAEKYIVEKIDSMTTIQPEQRTGKWIDGIIPNDSDGLPVIVCDQCNTFFPLQFGDGHNFCPNCGAKMTEGDAE